MPQRANQPALPLSDGVAEVTPRGFGSSSPAAIEGRRRLMAFGVDALDEADVLTLVLERALPAGADPAAAAETLIDRLGGVGRVLGAPTADLARIVGVEGAAGLDLLHRLLVRCLAVPIHTREVLGSTEAVKAYLRVLLRALPREVFHVLFLDRKNQLIADERMGEGTVDHAPVYPREIVRRALELSASAVLLVHNHPSGDATPSSADIEMTRRVVEAARALGIAVHDHLVVAGDQVASLRGLGLM